MFGQSSASACTNVFFAADGHRLVGANLDCANPFPRIWFVPAGSGQYGRYCYGTDQEEKIAEGGVNDQGLFIGVNAIDQPTETARPRHGGLLGDMVPCKPYVPTVYEKYSQGR